MPRIVAGAAGGIRLAVLPGDRTRPTSDRVKEAMFSALDVLLDLDGARVLDLYAGSGGLGLEAASRGAVSATLVESDPKVLGVLRANVAAAGLDGVEVLAMPAERLLAGRCPDGQGRDLLLADPPYSLDVTPVLAAAVDGGWLAAGGVVVCERSSRSPAPWPPGIEPIRSRRYGETTLWYGRRP